MRDLRRRGRVALTVLLLASVAAAAPATGAAVAPEDDASLVDWIGAWLARLMPGWTVAAGEDEGPPPSPTGDGIAFDDPVNGEICDPTIPDTCTGGEGWPDFDPDG